MPVNYIYTVSGRKFYPLDPRGEDIVVEDIGHALSNLCRFTGHVKEFYSVAEHCLRVSLLLEDQGYNNRIQLGGLLHDASEAYLSDISTPVKCDSLLAGYRAAEHQLELVIADALDCPEIFEGAVKRADTTLLVTEARDVLCQGFYESFKPMAHPLNEVVFPMGPELARAKFLDRYHTLRYRLSYSQPRSPGETNQRESTLGTKVFKS